MAAVLGKPPIRIRVSYARLALGALRRTYRYRPIVLTNSPARQVLTNGIVLCHAQTWLTRPRLVSLPFSDHCQPLADSWAELDVLLTSLLDSFNQYQCKYLELRPWDNDCRCAHPEIRLLPHQSFCHHTLDLRPDLSAVFHRLHGSCIRRKIRRAEKENVTAHQGRSETLIRQFYGLLTMTRRHHGLVPQPFSWFRNLCDCLGEAMTIRVACWRDRPIAGILPCSSRIG